MGGAGYKAEIYAGGLGYCHVPEPKMVTGGGGSQLTQKNFNPKNRDRGKGAIPLKKQDRTING